MIDDIIRGWGFSQKETAARWGCTDRTVRMKTAKEEMITLGELRALINAMDHTPTIGDMAEIVLGRRLSVRELTHLDV